MAEMTTKDLQALLTHGETTWLDWKTEFDQALLTGKQHPNWDAARGELLKDIASLANTHDGQQAGYLVVGVTDHQTHRAVHGTNTRFDDAMFQDWSTAQFAPLPRFTYEHLTIEGQPIGIFQITRVPDYPHVSTRNLGVLQRGQVWFRRGSRCDIAGHSELRQMFRPLPPIGYTNPFDPGKLRVEEHYRATGQDIAWIALGDKEARLAEGWSLAYHPDHPAREVQITYPGSESVLMLRPAPRER
jgi:hypothetical protein